MANKNNTDKRKCDKNNTDKQMSTKHDYKWNTYNWNIKSCQCFETILMTLSVFRHFCRRLYVYDEILSTFWHFCRHFLLIFSIFLFSFFVNVIHFFVDVLTSFVDIFVDVSWHISTKHLSTLFVSTFQRFVDVLNVATSVLKIWRRQEWQESRVEAPITPITTN